MKRWIAILILVVLSIAAFVIWTRPPSATTPPQMTLLPSTEESGFARAIDVIDFEFPRDHGPHPDFQTEWWYYTGNLNSADGRHYGYQLTFFRRALAPGQTERHASLATNQIYFAHFALTDVERGTHREWERFSRSSAGLAGAEIDPLRIWLENWSAEARDEQGQRIRLQAEVEGASLDLHLQAEKPIVAHGQNGLSPKSEEVGSASYYLSYTRMETQGELSIEGERIPVRGASWFDHEWSTSALGPGVVGWDWFSLQFDDGRELMYFQIRREDGSVEPVSSGTLVEPDGSTMTFDSSAIDIEVLDQWKSPESGALYPGRWRISLPSAGVEVTVGPWLQDQEMNVSFTYWEGAVRLQGESGGEPVEGVGYIELTGYAESMQGTF